jgi:predicted DNA-binding protein (MmcQ/YjbR family)
MDLNELKSYILTKTESTLDFPFGADVYVFKVKKKMFALIGHREGKMMLNLKCDPDESWMLRDIFPSITPGYHMNKRLWISVYFDGTVPQGEVERLIDNSYQLVVQSLSKKLQLSLL